MDMQYLKFYIDWDLDIVDTWTIEICSRMRPEFLTLCDNILKIIVIELVRDL